MNPTVLGLSAQGFLIRFLHPQRAQYPLIKENGLKYIGLHMGVSENR